MKKTQFVFSLLMLFSITIFAQENKEDFKPSGKFDGQVFLDYFYVSQADADVTTFSNALLNSPKDFNAFKIRRMHFGYGYNFSNKISTMIRLDIDENSLTYDGIDKTTNTAKTGKISAYVKDAYIKYSIFDGSELTFGIHSTLAFEQSEKVWGHRYIEKMIWDARGAVGARDFGISLRGKIITDGSLTYGIMISNNSSLNPEKDNYKRFSGVLGMKLPCGFEASVYADYAAKANNKSGINADEYIFGGFIGYKKSSIAIGIDAYAKNTNNAFTNPADSKIVTLNAFGLSAYASYKFGEKSGIFARFDSFDPNTHEYSEFDRRNYFIAGYEYSPAPNVTISPNVVFESYEKSSLKSFDASIWPRLTLTWQIK